jgi:AcrR family transcriptional regulator
MNPVTQGPLQEARKNAYRVVIIATAERIFANRGFEATKIQDIAEEIGVSVGTIYSVFGSKSELFDAVLTHRLPELLDIIHKTADNAPSILEKLIEGLDAFVIYMLEHPYYLQLHLREHAWGLGPNRAASGQIVAWQEGLDLEASILQFAMDEGIIIKEDPHRLARCITAIHQVQLWDWVENGMKEPPRTAAERIRKLFLQMFCIKQVQNTP